VVKKGDKDPLRVHDADRRVIRDNIFEAIVHQPLPVLR
jgi:hypothetical protein